MTSPKKKIRIRVLKLPWASEWQYFRNDEALNYYAACKFDGIIFKSEANTLLFKTTVSI